MWLDVGKAQSFNINKMTQGLTVNSCLRCQKLDSNGSGIVQSCKFLVEASSSSELSYELLTYTDTDCADNESSVASYVWDTGTCYDDSWTYSLLPGLTDLSQLGNGMMYVDYQDPDSSCTSLNTVFEITLVGYYEDYCYCVTSPDNFDDDDNPHGCQSLHYNGDSSWTATVYFDYDSCEGRNVEQTYTSLCMTDDAYNGAWHIGDTFTNDDVAVYINASSTNCYGLDTLTKVPLHGPISLRGA